jgi:predicted DNA-binding protein (MmcQ/YjbR family)
VIAAGVVASSPAMTIPERTLSMLRALPGVTEDIKWGADLCYSVGQKMFAVFGMAPHPNSESDEVGGSFKVRDEEFEDLAGRPGLRPAPYLARAKWVAFDGWRALPIAELEARLVTSYELVKAGLPKKTQAALGGAAPAATPKARGKPKPKARTKSKLRPKAKSKPRPEAKRKARSTPKKKPAKKRP